VRREQGGTAQMQLARGEPGHQRRVLPRGPRHRDAQVRLGLGQVQDAGRVHEHRGRGRAQVEAPRIHLAQVRDELGLDTA
jgi:hypothetical protein